ncbi:MAG TPA: YbjQ family protein [Candidatus Methylomirabilis sp.]|nr:YbjQ family protein [Candidatus Methylomirabilis sp.]
MAIRPEWVTTALAFDGYRISHYRGVVRGITVRSRNLVVNFGAWIQTLFGGNITLYTQLCEHAREEAFDLMCQHAAAVGANAVISMRYDANDVAPGVTEVLAYGTAVVIEPLAR